MAINDRFQLTNYGSEVQQAVDNALIYHPEMLAERPTYSEVLYFGRTIPFTPTKPYEPVPKIYLDETNSATNQRLDDEIARATAAEKVLNDKHVLTWDESTTSYKYINLKDIDINTQALVDENALDAKLGELSLGFFVFHQITDSGDIVDASKTDEGINPDYITDSLENLPNEIFPSSYAIKLKNDTSVEIYKFAVGVGWVILSNPPIQNGWLFAEKSSGNGYYWFQNTWNKIDMNVDMSQYYKKTEIDTMLTDYVQKVTLGDPADLTTTDKTTIVGAINSVKSLADTKDTLPSIGSHYVLANTTSANGKPTGSVQYSSSPNSSTLALRTASGTLRAANAVATNDLTTLEQVNNLIANIDLSAYQSKIAAGTANNIVAYSGTAGTLNTLTRVTSITNSANDTQIPTAKSTKTYVDNYKPIIVTQGNADTSVTTTQLTFWIEQ